LTPASRHDKTVYHSSNDLSDRRLAISTTRRPRIADVARLAKVSPAVVSVVVNGRTDSTIRISPETKLRVWQAVQETGYVANPVAQRLAHGKNRLLGVFTHEPVFPVDQRSFYYPFLVGIEREAEARGYDLLLFTSAHGADGVRSIFRDGANRLLVASGSVLLGWAQDRGEIRRLAEANYPFTYVGRREIEGLSIPFAAADYAAATEQIVDHLVQLGHRRILYLSSLPEREAGIDRRLGFVRAMLRHGLELPATLSTRHDPGRHHRGRGAGLGRRRLDGGRARERHPRRAPAAGRAGVRPLRSPTTSPSPSSAIRSSSASRRWRGPRSASPGSRWGARRRRCCST
jgi:DNA-binding LacI/PurR family transcriptional regulator